MNVVTASSLRKKVLVAAVATLLASVLVGGAAVAQAQPAKRSAPKESGGYTFSYADKSCADFINPTGHRIPTATCTRLISTLSGAQFAHDVEVTPLAGAGFSYGWADADASFVMQNVRLASSSVVPVSVSVHISRAEVFGSNLPKPGIAVVIAHLWVDGCATADDFAEVIVATTEGTGPARAANIDVTLKVNCVTSESQPPANVFVDVSSSALLDRDCVPALHFTFCGFVPGAGPLRALAEGTVGSVRIG